MLGYTEDPTPHASHRPWPIPARPWVMAQRWNHLLFAHWPIPMETLRARVPRALPLDLFEGQAWVSVTPFFLSHARPRGLPRFPSLSDFPELNFRTYVTLDGKPGVYFFSLDAGSRLAVEGARAFYHLPYFKARMHMEASPAGRVDYTSERTDNRSGPAVLRARYAPVGAAAPARPGTIEHWLVERYCLYAADRTGRTFRAEIHHRPWKLHVAECEIESCTIAAAAGLHLEGPPARLSFSQQIDVVAWWPQRVRPA